MKVDNKVIQYIENVVRTAQRVGVEEVIIEKDLVRAIDEDRTVVINHAFSDVDLPFDSVALSRINVLLSRLDLAKGQDNFTVDVTTSDGEGYVKTMLIAAKGVKVDFRCANPSAIRAPKSVSDTMKTLVPLEAEAVVLLQKGQQAMSADTVTIISNENGVSFEMYDVNSDKFTHTYEADVESLNGGDTDFVHTYPIKIVLPLFKENAGGSFSVGEKGVLNLQMNGINIYVLPQVG